MILQKLCWAEVKWSKLAKFISNFEFRRLFFQWNGVWNAKQLDVWKKTVFHPWIRQKHVSFYLSPMCYLLYVYCFCGERKKFLLKTHYHSSFFCCIHTHTLPWIKYIVASCYVFETSSLLRFIQQWRRWWRWRHFCYLYMSLAHRLFNALKLIFYLMNCCR